MLRRRARSLLVSSSHVGLVDGELVAISTSNEILMVLCTSLLVSIYIHVRQTQVWGLLISKDNLIT